MARKKPPEDHENLERWLVSYGDFMTLLLATFVVLYALSQVDLSEYSKLEASIKKAFNAPSILEGAESIMDSAGKSLLDSNSADSVIAPLMLEYISQKYEDQSFAEIKQALDEMIKNGDLQGVEVKITEEGLLITFKNDFLFYSGSAALTDEAMKIIDSVGAIVSEKFALHYIRVEGHTDNQPINTFVYPSNWELSSGRSSTIIRYLISRFKFLPDIFTAIGYSDTRPLTPNDTPENRAKNRRVEILILKNKYKKFEHPSNTIMKQSKKAQENFQKERMDAIAKVKESSDSLKRLDKSRQKTQENDANNNNAKQNEIQIQDTSKTTQDYYASTSKTTEEKPKKLSLKNKILYQQSKKTDTNEQHANQDDFWLKDIKNNKILQKDINKQFDMIGQ